MSITVTTNAIDSVMVHIPYTIGVAYSVEVMNQDILVSLTTQMDGTSV